MEIINRHNKQEAALNDYFEANRAAWNSKVAAHMASPYYGLAEFKEGKSTLYSIEAGEIGDVHGKSILHLQCHFGLDSMSLTRMGADVTGVDFSQTAIQTANQLAAGEEKSTAFILDNIYSFQITPHKKFDIVYCSYGAINWLPDLDNWASVVARHLKPEGYLYMVEFHPLLIAHDCLEDNRVTVGYFNSGLPITRMRKGTYADPDAPITSIEYTWNHSIAELVNALSKQGLKLEFLNEYPYLPFNCFPNLVQGSDGYWRVQGSENLFPLCYSLKARQS